MGDPCTPTPRGTPSPIEGHSGGPHRPHSQGEQGTGRGPHLSFGGAPLQFPDGTGGALGSPRDPGTGGDPQCFREGGRVPGTPRYRGTPQSLKEQGPPHLLGVLGDPNSLLGSLHPLCTRGGTPQFPERDAGDPWAGGDPDSLRAQHNPPSPFRGPQLSWGIPKSLETHKLRGGPQLLQGSPNPGRGSELL